MTTCPDCNQLTLDDVACGHCGLSWEAIRDAAEFLDAAGEDR